ncbi:MAG: carbohydrate ABC transporter permease [Bacilli bacterium]
MQTRTDIVLKVITYALLIFFSAVMLLPLLWMISSALKPNYEVFQFPPQLIPFPIHWSNFPRALNFVPFLQFFWNTCIIAIGSLIGSLVSNIMIGYAFARLQAKGKNILFYIILSTLMLPYAVTMIPQYAIFSKLHWVNTFWPLIVPAYFGNPFFIFLLRQFFLGIPRELEDAAAIDGAGVFRTIWKVILPLSWPAIVMVCIFQIQATWNDFLGPLLYLNKESMFTLQLGLQYFVGQYTGGWNLLMAASTVILLPILAMFYFGQKLFIKGIIVGGVKG